MKLMYIVAVAVAAVSARGGRRGRGRRGGHFHGRPDGGDSAFVVIDNDEMEGMVSFKANRDGGTVVRMSLSYKDTEAGATSGHEWLLHENELLGNDCSTAGDYLDPLALYSETYSCNADEPATTCFVGDMSGKLGTISVDGEYTMLVDTSLNISSIVNTSLVLYGADGSESVVSCGNIVQGRPPRGGKCGDRVAMHEACSAEFEECGWTEGQQLDEDAREAVKACMRELEVSTAAEECQPYLEKLQAKGGEDDDDLNTDTGSPQPTASPQLERIATASPVPTVLERIANFRNARGSRGRRGA